MKMASLMVGSLAFGILVGTGSAALASSNEVRTETQFAQTANTPLSAEGKADLRLQRGRIDFKVEVVGLPVGVYSLIVNSVARGAINVVADELGTLGEIEFRNVTSSNKLFLNFDPAGAMIEIVRQDGAVVFSGALGDAGPDSQTSTPMEIEFNLPPVGPQPLAASDLELTIRPDQTRFEVQIERVEPGLYDLFVDGNNVGTFQASLNNNDDSDDDINDNSNDDSNDNNNDNNSNDINNDNNDVRGGRHFALSLSAGAGAPRAEGEIVFQDPIGNDPNTRLLTFDPRGKVVEVRKDGVAIFSGVFPTDGAPTSTANAPTGCNRTSDLNGDGVVDSADMEILLTDLGPAPQDDQTQPGSHNSSRSRRRR